MTSRRSRTRAQATDDGSRAGVERDRRPRTDPYETVLEVGATLTGSLDLEHVLATIARQVGEALDVQYCDIHEYDVATDTLTCVAEWTPHPDPKEEAYVGTFVPVEERYGLRALLDDGTLLEEYVGDASLPKPSAPSCCFGANRPASRRRSSTVTR